MADPTKSATHTASFKLEDLGDTSDYLRILVYGVPGSGKTTLAGSTVDVPDMNDVLYLDLEQGRKSIKNNDRIKDWKKVTVVPIKDYKQLASVHKFLKAHVRLRDSNDEAKLKKLEAKFRGVEPEEIKTPKRFRTVVVDTLTEFNQICLYELLGLSTDMNLEEAMSDDGEVDVATFAEYKKNNMLVQLVTRAYRDLEMNSIFLCHQSYVQDELKRFHYAPALTGKLAGQVQGFVDIVGYLKVGKLKEGEQSAPRRMFIQPVGNFDAKSREASIKASYLDDPLMSDIWQAYDHKEA